MTEQEYLASDDPQQMLGWLTEGWGARPDGGVSHLPGFCSRAAGDRKLRLFACACCRQVWHLLADPRSRGAVEVAERYADGEATGADVQLASDRAGQAVHDDLAKRARPYVDDAYGCCCPDAGHAARVILSGPQAIPPAAQAALLRDVFGNPFRPAPSRHMGALWRRDVEDGREVKTRIADLTPTVLSVACRAYDERDLAALPLLADALEEAGCEEQSLLMHLRGLERCPEPGCPSRRCSVHPCPGWIPLRGPHVRGCWALDLLLGKE